ncbi:hypothetical protein ACWGJ2_12545 [Streptomyces sp. NPDC054796]
MSPSLPPDVAFGVIPDVGVAAAVTDTRSRFLHEALGQHGFTYSPDRDVYLLPPETGHDSAVKAVAAATRQFQKAGHSVAVDPRTVIPSDGGEPTAAPGQPPNALPEDAPDLREAAGAAAVIRSALDEGLGPLEELHELMETATTWCERLDSDEGREMAQHLRHTKHRVTAVNDHVMSALMKLEDMSRGLPTDAPARADMPLHEQHDGLPERHTSRSRAATAASPHRPGPTPQAALPPSPPAAQPPPGHRPTR